MTVLVVGGTGFVGGHVIHALRAEELDVRVLARRPEKQERFRAWGCEVVQGDMTNAESLRKAADGAETVVHLVALPPFSKPDAIRRVMEQGTRDLVSAAKSAGVRRFLLMSALGTSEETKDLVPYYGAKWEMERLVRASGVPHVIFRPSFVFGPDGGILPTFAKLARLAPVTPIIGSGRQRIQPIWADDVAAYFADGVARDDVTGRTFELGGPDIVSWDEFWRRLKAARGMWRPSIHVPVSLMRLNALVTERLPGNIPLTRDLLKMLEHGDNVVSNDDAARTFQLPLVPLDDQLRRAA